MADLFSTDGESMGWHNENEQRVTLELKRTDSKLPISWALLFKELVRALN